ncbi:MAG: dTDP-4-dehydrorhamnose reductase [Tannerella sp.]|jgi:dTDP-4-dehydrorhamnose reductase|nr:dTDP-4-dehydrorhamnose reductase [Tannerella sp.]
MKSVLVTGAYGQLGKALKRAVEGLDGLRFYFTDVDTLDICDKTQLERYFNVHAIDIVVNCAAYTAVDKAEDDAETCRRVNCDAVRNIGEAAAKVGAKVIHISTDYVFDGQGSRPYREDDPINPTSAYGKSKAEGEKALQDVCSDTIIVRTAWLYSETGNNFVNTMLRLARERVKIGVVCDQRGTPTYAGDLAAAIVKILVAQHFAPGIYHYTNAGECTWYDFACKIFNITGIDGNVSPITTSEYYTRAARPAYSVLDKTKIRETYNVEIPAWEESLAKCLGNITK